jgi:acyl-CoA synthetase (AMP-forming)/AMP-acid ligase II
VDGKPALGAVVVPKGAATLDAEQLRNDARQRLSAYKVPARWLVLASDDEMPRTAGGKIDRAALAELVRSGTAGQPR